MVQARNDGGSGQSGSRGGGGNDELLKFEPTGFTDGGWGRGRERAASRWTLRFRIEPWLKASGSESYQLRCGKGLQVKESNQESSQLESWLILFATGKPSAGGAGEGGVVCSEGGEKGGRGGRLLSRSREIRFLSLTASQR